MSTENGTTSTAAAKRAFDDSVSFFEDDDATKAKRCVTSGMILLQRAPTFASKSGAAQSYNPQFVAEMVEFAKQFIDTKKTVEQGGAGVVYTSLENYR